MSRLPLLIALALVLMATACTSGKKAYQKGNYSQAVIQAVERLRHSPDHKKSVQTLRQAYPLALETHTNEIEQLLRSADPIKYAKTVEQYEIMNHMAEEIRKCPAALEIFRNPTSYSEQLTAARQKAAHEAYELGVNLLNQNTREAARDAYDQFLNANRFVPGYQDVNKKIEQAKFDAALKVSVEQIPVRGQFRVSSDFFYDQIYSYLQTGIKNEFVWFYSNQEAKKLPYIDEILIMEFEEFIVGAVNEKRSEKEYTSKDSVKVGTATIDGRQVDVYNKVKAKLITNRREVVSSGVLTLRILDGQSRKAKLSRKFPGTFTWVNEWAQFNGDERALTHQQLEMCKRRAEVPPPHQQLFLEFTKPIFDQAKSTLKSYYRNY